MQVEEFIKQVKKQPRKQRESKLTPWREDLEKLVKAGCSVRQIGEFLTQNNVTIGLLSISNFLSKEGIKKRAPRSARPKADPKTREQAA